MVAEKRLLSSADIEAQTAIELPSRHTLQLVTLVISNVLNNNNIAIQVPVAVAASVCGLQVNVLATLLAQQQTVNCQSTAQGFAIAVQR